ncbi:MAG: hypothetical protein SPH37_05535, partial [Sodaliphilus sp.]|nr:hypothetical protein [Sodaliphilus sp.]
KTTQKSQRVNKSTGQQVNERVGVGLSNYRIIEFSKFRNFGLVEFWSGELLGKKLWEWWGFCIFVD